MEEEKNNQKSKKWAVALVFCIAVALGATSLAISQHHFTVSAIQKSDLPLEKLAQGYDFVCGTKDSVRLCIYDENNRTTVNPSLKLAFHDNKTSNVIKVDLYEIDAKNKDYCVKTFDADLKNQTNDCQEGVGFPKDKWSVSITTDSKGSEGVYEFRNSTK